MYHIGFNSGKEADVSEVNYAYGVVISQDCDLEQDYNSRIKPRNNDKNIPTIIVLPAYNIVDFKGGKHLTDGLAEQWNSDDIKKIKQNQNIRFHYIIGDSALQIPELIIDFKHVFTIGRDVIYVELKTWYLATICELFRESLTLRYSQYLSRIGLPELL